MKIDSNIVKRTILMAIVYAVVILILSKDYSSSNLLKVSIQGIIFAIVYGIALGLLERYRN